MTELREQELTPFADPIAPLRRALKGRYEIERQIGQGAFATVYLARDLKHERKVAIKVLNADPTSELGELRFIREIRTVARLQHPNILPLHDSGHVEALLYYVMPYVAGETLRDKISKERQLSLDVACNIARDAADALAYAHAQGIIHRDIKPENILLSAGHPILADFGIARVIDLAGVRQLTRTGTQSPGTPAYMSPEQLLGDCELDGRSDTYSLGCVFFEMLSGKPPFAGKDGFVKRFTEPPPSLRQTRTDLPGWIDGVIEKALARDPGDRFATAQDLIAALCGPAGLSAGGVSAHARSGDPDSRAPQPARLRAPIADFPGGDRTVDDIIANRQPPASRSWMRSIANHPRIAAASIFSFLAVSLAFSLGTFSRLSSALGLASAVDSTRIVVLPLAGTAPTRDRIRTTEGLYSALSEWRGLKITSDQDVREAIRSAGSPGSTRSAAALARKLGAGLFVWGQLTNTDSLNGRIELYDLNGDTPRKSVRVGGTLNAEMFGAIAEQLLEPANRPRAAIGGDKRTTSHPAWVSYANGHIALHAGDLPHAESAFRAAIAADPDFAPAHVWLAQTLEWKNPLGRQDWRDEISQGLRASSGLADKDRLVANALSQLAERRFPEACSTYRAMKSADSLDFVALYGLGQCQAFDSLVVKSSASPSGWGFRSRYSDAADSYMKALALNRSAHSILSFEQLEDLLPTAATKTRRGRNATGEEFAAFPALVRDTALFVPYPLAQFGGLSARQTAAAQGSALAHNLEVLRDFALEWTRNSPNSSSAFRALSKVLEAGGEIARSRSATVSALQAIGRAREFALSPQDSLLAATDEAWLLFKQGDFASARLLADSVLTGLRDPSPEQAEAVIGLAALTGKIARLAELSRLLEYSTATANLPIPVMDAAASLFAFSALGVCSDTTTRVLRKLDEQLGHYIAEDKLAQVSSAVKARPLSMLASCNHAQSIRGIPAGHNKLLRMQQALATYDSSTLRSLLVSLSDDAKTQRPGDISLDFTYQVAWLRMESGDTAAAIRQLDRALGALPSLDGPSLREAASAASVVRAMALRAELASARGETDTRRTWARAVVDLWSTADAPLASVITRMRQLAAPGTPP